jgi:Uma2 family endonuclease
MPLHYDRVNWEQYEALLARNADTSAYRVTYLDGALEIRSPSRRHENRKSRIGNLLEIYFLEADINYFPFGYTTLRREEKSGGTEPDEAYCIGTNKEFPDLVARSAILPNLDIELLAEYIRYPNSLIPIFYEVP